MRKLGAWRNQAACEGHDVDLFFPSVGQAGVDALRICQTCPVRTRCAVDAIDEFDMVDGGIRGGTTPRDRYDVRNGRLTLEQAMRRGDKLANENASSTERIARDEPWLAPVHAIPVPVRSHHRPTEVA